MDTISSHFDIVGRTNNGDIIMYAHPLEVCAFNSGSISGHNVRASICAQMDSLKIHVCGLQETGNRCVCDGSMCGDGHIRFASICDNKGHA
eukprot:3976557-Karenia_brevis.AAC.1